MSERKRRLFFALWPTDELRQAIEIATREAVLSAAGRAVPAQNFHITLVFLGSISDSRVGDLRRAANETLVEPFDLQLGKIASWVPQQVLCMEPLDGNGKVVDLVDRLRGTLSRRGFSVEERPFRTHLTLAREIPRSRTISEPIRSLRWPVERFELVESSVGEKGSTYTLL